MNVGRTSRRTDRVITVPADRREAVVDTIRRARRRLTLSLFRCTDDAIVEELARAVDRGVHVDVLVRLAPRAGKSSAGYGTRSKRPAPPSIPTPIPWSSITPIWAFERDQQPAAARWLGETLTGALAPVAARFHRSSSSAESYPN